jgi:hypothetical protein
MGFVAFKPELACSSSFLPVLSHRHKLRSLAGSRRQSSVIMMLRPSSNHQSEKNKLLGTRPNDVSTTSHLNNDRQQQLRLLASGFECFIGLFVYDSKVLDAASCIGITFLQIYRSMNRNTNKQDDRLLQLTSRDEGSMLLINAYCLLSLPSRRPTTMSDTEETAIESKNASTHACDDGIGGTAQDRKVSLGTPSKRTGTSTALSIQRSEIHATNLPPRNHDILLTRQRIPDAGRDRNCMYSSKRMRLLIFIKIILKCLADDDPSLHLKAKKIVTDCTRKNREGIPGYNPLADVITRQLRMTVGEVHWNRAKRLMEYYLRKRVEKPINAVDNQS